MDSHYISVDATNYYYEEESMSTPNLISSASNFSNHHFLQQFGHPARIRLFGVLLIALSQCAAAADSKADAPSKQLTSGLSPQFALEEVTVTGTRYGAKETTVGRLALPYVDVPQAASVVTSDLLSDAQLFSSDDALRFVPSVQSQSTLLGWQLIRNRIASRTYSDGFGAVGGAVGLRGVFLDTFFYDRIEVAKGPSPASFGRGDPAGFVNYISKRPQFKGGTEIGILAGTGNSSRNTYRATLDHSGFLLDDQQTAYRFTSMYTDGAESMEYFHYRRAGAQLAVSHKLSNDKGRLDLIALYSDNTAPGTLSFAWADPTAKRLQAIVDRWYGNASIDPADYGLRSDGNNSLPLARASDNQKTFRTTLLFDYEFNSNWRTRQAADIVSYDVNGTWWNNGDLANTFYLDPNGTLLVDTAVRTNYVRDRERSWQSDFLGTFDVDPIGANISVLFGGDITDGSTTVGPGNNYTASQALPVVGWNPGVSLGAFAFDPSERGLVTTGDNWSLYAQAQAKFWEERIQFSGAVRRIWQDAETLNRISNITTDSKNHSPLLPAYSLLLKPLKWLSLFATHSKHEEPATVQFRYLNLRPGDPRQASTIVNQPTTEQDEFGLKASLRDDQILLSATYYKSDTTGNFGLINRQEPNSDGTPYNFAEFAYTQGKNRGWEFEAFGQFGARLSFLLGGTLGGKSISTQPTLDETQLITVPNRSPDSLFGYLTYNLGSGRFDRLSLTAGFKAYFSGWTYATYPDQNDFQSLEFPDDRTTLDLGASYGLKDRYEFYLKCNNVLHSGGMILGSQSMIPGRQLFAGVNMSF